MQEVELYGIEALSRGASKAYFCDNNIQAIKIINKNLEKTRLNNKAIVINKDYKIAIREIKDKLDIIFLDPPYKQNISINAIEELMKCSLIKKETVIIIETDEVQRDTEEIEKNERLKIIDKRKYGRANLIFVKQEALK